MLSELLNIKKKKTEKNGWVPQFKKFVRVSQQKVLVCYIQVSAVLIRPRFSKTRALLLCYNIAWNRTITVVSRAEIRKDGCISLICAYEGDFWVKSLNINTLLPSWVGSLNKTFQCNTRAK